MSRLLVHLPPLAELHDENGMPILANSPLMDVSAFAGREETVAAALQPQGVSSLSNGAGYNATDYDAADYDAADFDVTDEELAGQSSDSLFGTPLSIMSGGNNSGTIVAEADMSRRVSEHDGQLPEDGSDAGIAFEEAGLPEISDEAVEWDSDATLALDDTSPAEDEMAGELALNDFEEDALKEDGGFEEIAQTDPEWADQEWVEPELSESSDGPTTFTEPVPPRPIREVAVMDFGAEERHFVTNPRVKRRKSSPMKTIVGVVIGGAAAFPIAAGILALAGKPLDLGFWPFDGQTIATKTSRSAAPPRDLASRPSLRPAGRPGRSLADDIPSLAIDETEQLNGSIDRYPGSSDDLTPKPIEQTDGSSITSTASTGVNALPGEDSQPSTAAPQIGTIPPTTTSALDTVAGTERH